MAKIDKVILGTDERNSGGFAAAPIDGRTLIYSDGSKETLVPQRIMHWRFMDLILNSTKKNLKLA